MRNRTFALCCVLDSDPRFLVEGVLWVLCATRSLPGNFAAFVYAMDGVSDDLTAWIRTQGVEVRAARPMVDGSPHSNKIAPFFEEHGADTTIVCDTDLYWLADPSGLFNNDRFRAAPNNHCCPPARVIKTILANSELERPFRPGFALFKGIEGSRETHINNISSGIVATPRGCARLLAEKWRKWAIWLVENRSLLEQWDGHVDQVAFALAMEELEEDVELLPPHVNTILHLHGEVSTCYALHLTSGHIPQFPALFREDKTIVEEAFVPELRNILIRFNENVSEAVDVIKSLPSTRDHLEKFLNPAWRR